MTEIWSQNQFVLNGTNTKNNKVQVETTNQVDNNVNKTTITTKTTEEDETNNATKDYTVLTVKKSNGTVSDLDAIVNCHGSEEKNSQSPSDKPMRFKRSKSINPNTRSMKRRRKSVQQSLTRLQRSKSFTNRRASFADQHGSDLQS